MQACPKVKPLPPWIQSLSLSKWLPNLHNLFTPGLVYMEGAGHLSWEVPKVTHFFLVLLEIPFSWFTTAPFSLCIGMEDFTPFHILVDFKWCYFDGVFQISRWKTVLSVPYYFSQTASVNPQILSVSPSPCASRSYSRFFPVKVYPLFKRFQHFFAFYNDCCYCVPFVGSAHVLHFLWIPRRQTQHFPSITPAHGLRALRTSWKAY